MTDREYIDGLVNRDERIFGQFIQQYQDQVYRICIGFVHDIEDAEELVQDVFIEVYRKIETFRAESKLSTWLYRIAVNKSLNVLRKKKRLAIITSFELFKSDEKSTVDFPDQQQKHPLEMMEMKEDARKLYQAIEALPKNQRIAFTLNKYEDLPYKEIARIMELSLSAVESLIHRAKLNLQKQLLKE